MSCKYPENSRMYKCCALCNDNQLCKDSMVIKKTVTSKGEWIACKDVYPEAELTYDDISTKVSKPVLVQTKREEMFVATLEKTVYKWERDKEHFAWFTYGTGGRKMKVMSKVVAWMPLPEPYKA